jgi:hypothetical protein
VCDEEVGDAVDMGDADALPAAPDAGVPATARAAAAASTEGRAAASSASSAASPAPQDFNFSSLHPGVLASLPRFISEQLPCIFTNRGAIDRLTLEGLKVAMASSTSVEQELQRVSELLGLQFYHNMHLYYAFAQSLQATGEGHGAWQRG